MGVAPGSALLLCLALIQSESDKLPKVERLSGDPKIWRPVKGLQLLSGETAVASVDRLGTDGANDAHILVDGEFRVVFKKGPLPAQDRGVAIEHRQDQLFLSVMRKGTLAVESAGKAFEIDLGKELGSVSAKDAFVVVSHPEGSSAATIVVFHGSATVSNELGKVELEVGDKAEIKPRAAPVETKAQPRDTEWPRDAELRENLLDQPSDKRQERCTWGYKVRDGMKWSSSRARAMRPGATSLLLELDTKATSESFPAHVDVTLEPGAQYMLHVFAWTDKYTVDGKPGQLGLTVLPVTKTPDGKEDEDSNKRVSSDSTLSCEGRWQCLRLFFPAPAASCRIRLYKGKGGDFAFKGAIYVTDWFLTRLRAGVVKPGQ